MLYFDGALGLILFCLWVFCIVDVIVTDEYSCRNLPKIAWLFLVILVPDIGSIIWLVAGRPHSVAHAGEPASRPRSTQFPEYDRPGRHIAVNPEDDAEFLRKCRERAEEQRRRAREKRLPESDDQ